MPLTPDEDKQARELIALLQKSAKAIKRPVLVTEEMMDIYHRASRMRMNVSINGVVVVLQEDFEANPNLEEAVQAACQKEEDAPPPLAEGKPHEGCGGRTVKMDDGSIMCVKCKEEVVPKKRIRPAVSRLTVTGPHETNEHPQVMLASERAKVQLPGTGDDN